MNTEFWFENQKERGHLKKSRCKCEITGFPRGVLLHPATRR